MTTKIICYIAFNVIFLLTLVSVAPASAHPGRTASDGCHYCRTNCDSWGVAWNERHCHGGSTLGTASNNPEPTNTIIPTAIPTKIVYPTNTPTLTPSPTKILYKVIGVTDGDTITVDINGVNEPIRFIGIDTPETVDPRKPVQCFGKEASNKLKELLEGKQVILEPDSSQGERDKYDRLLRYVFLEDGTNINELMIREGFAHEYTYNLPYKFQETFKKAESEARETKKGLWGKDTCNGQALINDNNSENQVDGEAGITKNSNFIEVIINFIKSVFGKNKSQ